MLMKIKIRLSLSIKIDSVVLFYYSCVYNKQCQILLYLIPVKKFIRIFT